MRTYTLLVVSVLTVSTSALGQSDLILLLNPNPNEDRIILRSASTLVQTVEDKTNGSDVRQFEQGLSLRYGVMLQEDRELYLSLDAHLLDLDTNAVLDESLTDVPGTLYDVGVGLLYRQTVKEDWRVGGQLRVGSASDRLFNSFDETYLKGLGFLQIPHLEYTSWIVLLAVNTDLQIPVFPGVAYQFPISRRAMAVLGIPILGAAGQLSDRIAFQLVYYPIRNANARISFQATERLQPYAGFQWRGIRFNRAERADDDDRILFQDKRFFTGITFDITKNITFDINGGYLFDRQIGEGDDDNDQLDNNLRFESAWYGGFRIGMRF